MWTDGKSSDRNTPSGVNSTDKNCDIKMFGINMLFQEGWLRDNTGFLLLELFYRSLDSKMRVIVRQHWGKSKL